MKVDAHPSRSPRHATLPLALLPAPIGVSGRAVPPHVAPAPDPGRVQAHVCLLTLRPMLVTSAPAPWPLPRPPPRPRPPRPVPARPAAAPGRCGPPAPQAAVRPLGCAPAQANANPSWSRRPVPSSPAQRLRHPTQAPTLAHHPIPAHPQPLHPPRAPCRQPKPHRRQAQVPPPVSSTPGRDVL